jgi:4'-phosphopantetheinyl transferase
VTVSLDASDVHVYYCATATIDRAALTNARETLSVNERRRCARLRVEEDRRDFTIAHDLLRRSLSRYAPVQPDAWEFAANAYGKPQLVNGALSFSLSHTRGLVACAVAARMPIGIDVESVSRGADPQIADRFFSAWEAAMLHECPEDRRRVRFIELWTLKEAFLKALGLGLSRSLASVSFDVGVDGTIVCSSDEAAEVREFQFALLEPAPHTRLAVAARPTSRASFLVREVHADHAYT